MGEQQNPNPTSDHAGLRITRLPRNGPKDGQSTSAWLYGKQRADERLVDDLRTPLRGITDRRRRH